MPAKYYRIGIDHNITRKADPYITVQLLTHLQPRPKGIYLDIGCGTGNYTGELQTRGFQSHLWQQHPTRGRTLAKPSIPSRYTKALEFRY